MDFAVRSPVIPDNFKDVQIMIISQTWLICGERGFVFTLFQRSLNIVNNVIVNRAVRVTTTCIEGGFLKCHFFG